MLATNLLGSTFSRTSESQNRKPDPDLNLPRVPIGLTSSALDQFNKTDPEKITGFLLDLFSPDIRWAQAVVEIDAKSYGIFRIFEDDTKPVIAKKDEGKDQIIRAEKSITDMVDALKRFSTQSFKVLLIDAYSKITNSGLI